jgi:hypothetical protein
VRRGRCGGGGCRLAPGALYVFRGIYHRVTSVRRTLATVLLSKFFFFFEQRGAPEALIFIHLIGSVQRVLHIPEIVKIGR